MKKESINISSSDLPYLCHHGVKGMKWGVRKGPPYPIDVDGNVGKTSDRITILSKGDKAYRVSSVSNERNSGHAFISYKDKDHETYINHVKELKQVFGDDKWSGYDMTLKVTKDLVAPSKKRAVDELIKAWSVQRTINVYAVPTVQLNVTDSTDSEVTTLESFPFYIKAETAPNTQSVLSYHVSITSTQAYSTSDRTGTETVISRGQEVYSLFTDGPQNLLVELNAGNIDLENNITYKVTCTASFDSGLTASAESEFDVGWTEQTYGINAEIGYDSDTYSCSIRAYCADEGHKLIPGVTLAIYRRDYTGELIEIASGLDNSSYTYVTDPHPALDYGRYRIVATEVATGAVSYYDVPPYPIKEKSIIIQWEETWDNLVTEGLNERDIVMEPLWSGSLVKLPYNIDVSDKNGVDVSLVEYIGRKRPVSYYGTQLGETSSWKTEIPRWDIDTLYALRRLAVYTGDVYIREPSGTGYWANVAVSISQTHCEVKIPISFDITRVEGGI